MCDFFKYLSIFIKGGKLMHQKHKFMKIYVYKVKIFEEVKISFGKLEILSFKPGKGWEQVVFLAWNRFFKKFWSWTQKSHSHKKSVYMARYSMQCIISHYTLSNVNYRWHSNQYIVHYILHCILCIEYYTWHSTLYSVHNTW